MLSVEVLGALAGLGVVCTGLAFVMHLELIKEAGPSRVLLFSYVNPAVAVVAGVLLLNEPLTVLIFVSFVLILVGCARATRARAFRGLGYLRRAPARPGHDRRRRRAGRDVQARLLAYLDEWSAGTDTLTATKRAELRDSNFRFDPTP